MRPIDADVLNNIIAKANSAVNVSIGIKTEIIVGGKNDDNA